MTRMYKYPVLILNPRIYCYILRVLSKQRGMRSNVNLERIGFDDDHVH